MAKTIGQLTQATTLASGDEFVIEQSGLTKRVAASVVRGGLVNADIDAAAAIAGSKLADGGIVTAKIADANVTTAKLAAATQELLVPAGAIMPFARSTAPSGWLACDGSEVAIATYGTLSTAIYVGDGSNADADLVYGFKTNGSGTRSTSGTHIKLPDLRGEFIRGWDNARGIDSSRKNRSYQDDAIQQHTHSSAAAASGSQLLAGGVNGAAVSGSTTGNMNSGRSNSAETRPRNVTALYCIKF
jgi:microcystin-dependent protein